MTALNITPDGKQPKNGFDLGNFETSTLKGGAFQVVGFRETVPNSDYRMSVDAFTRTIPCNTANFAHIKENYYFIHVPLGLLDRNAYQTMVDRKQQYSALDFGIEQFPVFPLYDVVARCFEISQLDLTLPENQKFKDVHGFNIGVGAIRLLDLLGYGCYVDILEAFDAGVFPLGISTAKAIVFPLANKLVRADALAAYQCAWYHFFRNDIYDNEVSARCFNFDDVTVKINSGDVIDYNILHHRSIDDFIIECCQQRYVGYKKDLYTAFMPGTQFGPVSSIAINDNWEITISGTGRIDGVTGNDFDRHSLVKSNGDPASVSFDTGNTQYFDSNLSPYGGPNSLGITDAHQHETPDTGYYLRKGGPVVDSDSFVYDVHNHLVNGTATLSTTGSIPAGQSLFDVLQLVEAQAIQKWRQKSMLAGNKTADQFRAHHGVVPRHLIDHLPDFIGSVDNEIQITEITSQADTATEADESNLGEIRGRGYGASNNKVFNFHSDDYGILLLIHAIVPENTYTSYGIHPMNTRVFYNDFYQSEFTNLGLQPIPKFNLDSLDLEMPSGNSGGTGTETFTPDVGIIGYAPRDYGYKEYPSRVHGLFNPGRLMIGQQQFPWSPNIYSRFGYDDMQSFTLTRRDLVTDIHISGEGLVINSTLHMSLSNLYVHPSLFDSIFDVAADNSQTTDEFINHARFVCDSSLPMPVLGLPQF